MELKELKETIELAKANSLKRNFKQTVDLIINLKSLDLKKPDQQLDIFIQLHNKKTKKSTICGLVGPELAEQSKEAFDNTILVDDFQNYTKNKGDAKKLARSYDFFVAQANIMGKVAQTFGRSFGPKGKMPNPKAGCVVPPNANLKALADRLQTLQRLKVRTHPALQVAIGTEDTDIGVLADNAKTVYDQLVHHLPQEKNNIKNVIIKLTMGKAVKVGEKPEPEDVKAKPKKKKVKDKTSHADEKKAEEMAPEEEKPAKKAEKEDKPKEKKQEKQDKELKEDIPGEEKQKEGSE